MIPLLTVLKRCDNIVIIDNDIIDEVKYGSP